MNEATLANVRTANVARKGAAEAIQIAFSAGAIMGLTVVGLNLVGITFLFLLFPDPELHGLRFRFFLGGPLCPFRRWDLHQGGRRRGGPGWQTGRGNSKTIRNPAVIADNVGDNVGDVCGMGSDLFESEAEVMVAAMAIGTTLVGQFGARAIVGPVLLFAIGVVASVIGIYFVKVSRSSNATQPLTTATT